MLVRMGGKSVYGKGGCPGLSSPGLQSHQPSFKPRPRGHPRPPLSSAVTISYGSWAGHQHTRLAQNPIYCLQQAFARQIDRYIQ